MARILVIDDDRLARYTILQFLDGAGHEVVEASSGRLGVSHHQSQNFELVITDIVMPDMEGIAVIREIRKTRPDQQIIAVTGGGATGRGAVLFLRFAQELGADRVLKKPFTEEDLLACVDACLSIVEP